MANLIIENTGVDHVYPDGVPIVVLEVIMTDIFKRVVRVSSLAVLADPYFSKNTVAQKFFSELHPEGDRISDDFLKDAAGDILPVFSPFQRWMVTDVPLKFEYNSAGKIIYRWLNMDTRQEYTLNYTPDMYQEIIIDPNVLASIKKYLENALVDFLLKELYRAIGYDKKYIDYFRSYEQNRQYVAYWLKNDRSTKTQYRNAGV